MIDLPEPLTPPDCDLRGMPFMPLDTVRLLDSDFFALATAEEFRVGLVLWCKSWQQVPAASLPDDDRILAHLSGMRDRWRDVRDMSLHGWIKCSDGRLYHPVVAEKAMEALPQRKEYRQKKTAEAERKARERQDRSDLFSALKMIGITPDFNIKTKELRDLAAKHKVTIGHADVTVTCHAPVTAKTETVKGQGYIIEEPYGSSRPPAPDHIGEAFRLWTDCRAKLRPNGREQALTLDRRTKIAARLKDLGGIDGWRQMIANILGTPFLRGEKNGWTPDLDWLLTPKNLRKVMEGTYDDEPHGANGSGGNGGGVRPSAVSALTAARAIIGPQ